MDRRGLGGFGNGVFDGSASSEIEGSALPFPSPSTSSPFKAEYFCAVFFLVSFFFSCASRRDEMPSGRALLRALRYCLTVLCCELVAERP